MIKLKTFKLTYLNNYGIQCTEEVSLPDTEWFRDDDVDGCLCDGYYNYTAFVDKKDITNTDYKIIANYCYDLGDFYMVYVRNVRLNMRKFADKLSFPKFSVLYSAYNLNYLHHNVFHIKGLYYPQEYIGGLEFRCIQYNIFGNDATIERTNVQFDFSMWYPKPVINCKCAEIYRNGICDMILNGSTSVDFSPIENHNITDLDLIQQIQNGDIAYKIDGTQFNDDEIKSVSNIKLF